MTLQTILDAIQEHGRQQVCQIEAQASSEAEAISASAGDEAEEMRRTARCASSRLAAAECARILYRARMDSLQALGDASQTLQDAAVERLKEKLSDARGQPSYSAVLRCLIEEALARLQGSLREDEQAHIQADRCDQELIEHLLRDAHWDVTVDYALHSWGGIVACSPDAQVVVNNTL